MKEKTKSDSALMMRESLANCLALVKLQNGNLYSDVNQVIAKAEDAINGSLSGFHAGTMESISTLCDSVEGSYLFQLVRSNGNPPLGEKQEYEGETVNGVTHEYVRQTTNGGFTGDEFAGTVTFILGDFHLVVSYAT